MDFITQILLCRDTHLKCEGVSESKNADYMHSTSQGKVSNDSLLYLRKYTHYINILQKKADMWK